MIDVAPRPNGYDGRHWLYVKGTGDLGDGQSLKLNLGEQIVCGRSRWCDWSLKKSPRYLKNEGGHRERVREGLPWKATSRRHCRIAFVSTDMVEVENLSTNGTLVDGHRVDRVVLTDCRTQAHRIQLGEQGVLLELLPGSLPLS